MILTTELVVIVSAWRILELTWSPQHQSWRLVVVSETWELSLLLEVQ